MPHDTDDLRAAEQRFHRAQVAGDLHEIDLLLHPDFVFVGPDGTISDRDTDLAVHRDGRMRLDTLEVETLDARVTAGTGITVLTAMLTGSYGGYPFSSRQRYTRAWAFGPEGWRIVAAHASVISPDIP